MGKDPGIGVDCGEGGGSGRGRITASFEAGRNCRIGGVQGEGRRLVKIDLSIGGTRGGRGGVGITGTSIKRERKEL